MKIFTSYDVRVTTHEFNKAFQDTVNKFRLAVDFFIDVFLQEPEAFVGLNQQKVVRKMELLSHKTKENPAPKYDFDVLLYKFPSYYRRAAIAEAYGKVSSYRSSLKNWEEKRNGKKPGLPKAGYCFPALYHDQNYNRLEHCTAEVKVWTRNTWDWVTIPLRKTDADYISKHCSGRNECAPILMKRHKFWVLNFPFQEEQALLDVPLQEQTILAVDLGINSACVCTAMRADGTIVGRKFLSLPTEEDSLSHALNKIKKAQQHGNRRMPRLWAYAKGINDQISVKTAQFIVDTAVLYSAFTIVFEHLETRGKKRGRRMRQRIHHWRAQYVQGMVTNKAHRLAIHISRVNAWGTSRLAFDGSGEVARGKDAGFETNALCRFQNGKIYNCDLSASYNIGARYFIREILKSLPAKERLRIEDKLPQCSKRSTCTLSTLISLNAELSASA